MEDLVSKEKCRKCYMWYCYIDKRTGTLEEIIERLHEGAMDHETALLDDPESSDISRYGAESVSAFTNVLMNIIKERKELK